MDGADFEDFLRELIETAEPSYQILTFKEAGIHSKIFVPGIVVRTEDGAEFQLSIIQSRYPEEQTKDV